MPDRPEMIWNGSHWWKVDFHSHSPASDDYGKGPNQSALKSRTPREWLLDYMVAGLDCVMLTDHNSGAWIDSLKQELVTMGTEKPENFRPLVLFPGVEISVNGGTHLLAIFDPTKTTSDIDSFLGAAGYSGRKGFSDDVTTKSILDVLEAIKQAGGIPIPAHVDKDNGLFKLQGPTLEAAFQNKSVFAMELVDPTFAFPQAYTSKKLTWAEVLGSDAHHPTGNAGQRFPGSHFTWVKMGNPTIEGLRLALLDGELSIQRSDKSTANPNDHATQKLESIQIYNARYMGRATPFKVALNPWLNAVIGGRGTGKSTIVEFLRIAFRRTDELPEELKTEFEKYGKVYASREDVGLLTPSTTVDVVYKKDNSTFRIRWNPAEDVHPIEEEINGVWTESLGDVRQLFPIRIYSQKQIFHLASKPSALLGIVDEAPSVDRRSWEVRWKAEEAHYLTLRASLREVQSGLQEESRLRGELSDVIRKMAVFEEAGHADVLKAYEIRSRQTSTVDTWEETWSGIGDALREAAVKVVPQDLSVIDFDMEAPEDKQIQAYAIDVIRKLKEVQTTLHSLATVAESVLDQWQQDKSRSLWKASVDQANATYHDLETKLTEEGVEDPNAYAQLVTRRQEIEKSLKGFEESKKQLEELEQESRDSQAKLLSLRREITRQRTAFLNTVLGGNRYVNIHVVPYGDRELAGQEFRELVQRADGGFEKDIGEVGGNGLLGRLFSKGPAPEQIEAGLSEMKSNVRKIALGDYDPKELGDQRFATHLAKLNPESLDRIDVWFPEDTLDVRYSPTGDGQSFRSIQEGSPGQKTAALLAFLLSYGHEPLVLDQPEDDLDNHLIYDLIVTQLREVKRRRQIVVITHNANIVVNGDAELVAALAARGGETQQECVGSLQERKVRSTICDVMEGGRKAFDDRYRRIALED